MNAELTNTRKRTRLDRKFDRLRDAEEAGKLGKSKTSRAVRKMLENRLAVIGLVVFAIILISCLLAPLISPYDPLTTDLRAMTQPPSLQHLFGTDKLGRDVFSRTLYGGRLSILIGLGSALGAAVIGVLLGCYGGYKGGLFDKIVLRLSEIFMSFPQLILVMMLGTIFGRGLWNLIFIFILTGWGGVYRQARAKMLSLREEEYVQSMRAFGLSDFVIAYKHMLPNAIGPVVVNLTLSTAMFILDEAAMSFLGLGVPPEIATWGNILNAAQDLYVMQNYWWLWLGELSCPCSSSASTASATDCAIPPTPPSRDKGGSDMEQQAIITVKDLRTYFYSDKRCNKVLNGVSFELYKGRTLCVVGESGCGKSVTASSIMQLLPKLSRIESGAITYHSEKGDIRIDQLPRNGKEMRALRGRDIAMIFQDPMTALNPVYTIGFQIGEDLKYHTDLDKRSRRARTLELLTQMGISTPEKRIDQYPHEFSGGMRQRAMIAMAMSCSPKVLIADEPTTALDVTIQAQIFELMEKLKREHDTAIMLITHDMGVVSELADDVAVMYMGSIVERGSVREVLKYPAHPYTAALLRSIPILHKGRGQRLEPIRGSTPDPYDRPKGCQFAPRCDFCCEKCRQEMPSEVPVCDGHAVRCWNAEQVYAGHREEVEAV